MSLFILFIQSKKIPIAGKRSRRKIARLLYLLSFSGRLSVRGQEEIIHRWKKIFSPQSTASPLCFCLHKECNTKFFYELTNIDIYVILF